MVIANPFLRSVGKFLKTIDKSKETIKPSLSSVVEQFFVRLERKCVRQSVNQAAGLLHLFCNGAGSAALSDGSARAGGGVVRRRKTKANCGCGCCWQFMKRAKLIRLITKTRRRKGGWAKKKMAQVGVGGVARGCKVVVWGMVRTGGGVCVWGGG